MAYIIDTKDKGLVYWRAKIRNDLEYRIQETTSIDIVAPNDPWPEKENNPFEIVTAVDCSYATCTKGRSMTGVLIWFGGHLVCWKTKVQPVVAVSSTEGELIAACFAGKAVKFVRTIVTQIGFPQENGTIIYEDNAATILIVNDGRPTQRTRHVDIQTFAIQEWRLAGILVLKKIHTSVNPADGATKALDFTLFHRHVNRMMGLNGKRKYQSETRQNIRIDAFRRIIPGLA